MKVTKVTTRLNANEYIAIKRQAKIQKKSINTLMVELMLGRLCLCPHHEALATASPNYLGGEILAEATKIQELTYETLILLRNFTALTDPRLASSAYEQRAEYFYDQENDGGD